MKTIFSYIAKCLLVYTISFTLLQVQVLLPVQSLKYAPGYVQAETGVSDDGVATETGKVELEGEETSLAVDLLASFAFGYVTSRALLICKPIPIDIGVAAAGGIAFIGGEIYAYNGFKDIKDSKTVEFIKREDGDNTEQVTYLENQKEGYDDIAKVAKTKAMIQTAAAAAYGIASIIALFAEFRWFMQSLPCKACAPIASTALEAKKLSPGVDSKADTTTIHAFCASKIKEATLTAAGTAGFCSGGVAACVAEEITCTTETSICLMKEFSILGQNGEENSFQKFAKNNIKIPEFDVGLDEETLGQTLEETQLASIADSFGIQNFIDRENPFYDLSKSLKIDQSNIYSQINSYAKNRDMMRYYKGDLSSSTIDQYDLFKQSILSNSLNSSGVDLGESLQMAFENGMDFFIPRVHASNSLVAILGAATGIVLALFKATSTWMDTFMSTPGWRALAWGIGAGLAMVAASETKKIQETAEENSEKIQKIITQLKRIGKTSTENLSGADQGIPSRIPFPKSGNDGLDLGPGKTPCPNNDKTSGCSTIVDSVQTNRGFAALGGTMGNLALDAAAVGDGFSGTGSVPGSTTDKTFDLARDNEGIQSKLRKMQTKLNKEYEKNGKPTIDFDKMNKKLLAKLKKKVRNQLKRSKADPKQILASLGAGAPKESKEEEKVANKGPSPVAPGTTGKSKPKKAPVFSLDLEENPGGNEGLTAEEVLANQQAANELNAEAVDDIVTNKGVSIFKVISVRYLKSGFSRLLDEEKKE
jgi:hypothetical protein